MEVDVCHPVGAQVAGGERAGERGGGVGAGVGQDVGDAGGEVVALGGCGAGGEVFSDLGLASEGCDLQVEGGEHGA